MKFHFIYVLLINILIFVKCIKCFVPAKFIRILVNAADRTLNMDFGEQNKTIVHEDIIKRGIINSVAKYFYEKTNSSLTRKIDLKKLETGQYYEVKNLFIDYYNRTYCSWQLELIIKKDFQLHVAAVDFDDDTKDNPAAHFDANFFHESNKRVIDIFHQIHKYLKKKKYDDARNLIGNVMHTIHDFYSHSNWVEMGNRDINKNIGTKEFDNQPVVDEKDRIICVNNCSLITIKCNKRTRAIILLMKAAGINSNILTCPVQYYKCKGNLINTKKLVSGFYVNQKLENGKEVRKPNNMLKCSHGGIIDDDSYKITSLGGMNKDSGYYLFSPRADLHLIAANLAIKHTEYFFDQLREKYGDNEFEKLLKLNLPIGNFITLCSSSCFNYYISPKLTFLTFILTYLLLKEI